MNTFEFAIVVSLLLIVHPEGYQAFCERYSNSRMTRPSATAIFDGNGTGGWGIGGQREITPEEFARGDRRYFDGYKMNEQGDFIMKIQEEKEALENDAMTEFLGVANFAGLNVKDPSKKLNKFDASMFDDDDDDDLDLSV